MTHVKKKNIPSVSCKKDRESEIMLGTHTATLNSSNLQFQISYKSVQQFPEGNM